MALGSVKVTVCETLKGIEVIPDAEVITQFCGAVVTVAFVKSNPVVTDRGVPNVYVPFVIFPVLLFD